MAEHRSQFWRQREEERGGEGIIYVASHEREMKDWIEAPCGMQERKEAWLWGAGCKVQDGLVGVWCWGEAVGRWGTPGQKAVKSSVRTCRKRQPLRRPPVKIYINISEDWFNNKTFFQWLTDELLSLCSFFSILKSIIIMNNASIHCNSWIKKLIILHEY